MSNYKNYIQDFPIRCGEILTNFQELSKKNNGEITLLFMVAAAAIPIPFEHLKKPTDRIKHVAHEREKYQAATGKFSNLCGQNFLGSDLWSDKPESWMIGEVDSEQFYNELESWVGKRVELRNDQKVIDILRLLRNAFAHGNIFTLESHTDEIQEIVFLEKIMKNRSFTGKYKFLTVTPRDFRKLMMGWIKFLSELQIPST